jgi:hypothetical protein
LLENSNTDPSLLLRMTALKSFSATCKARRYFLSNSRGVFPLHPMAGVRPIQFIVQQALGLPSYTGLASRVALVLELKDEV